jgi:hypothetical protein
VGAENTSISNITNENRINVFHAMKARRAFFANRTRRLMPVDDLSAIWLRIRAEATHKTPTEIIGELIREKIAVSL